MKSKHVVIVGGGATGALVAWLLLDRGASVTVIEPSARLGRGAAYGTVDPNHLLNVRASNMSALASDPGDFVRWLTERGMGGKDIEQKFVPRTVYGDYLADRLKSAISAATGTFAHCQSTAVGVSEKDEVLTSDGQSIAADVIVVALGNLPPGLPGKLAEVKDHPRLISVPWAPQALDRVWTGESVLILGTGLTMIDTVMALHARGHAGTIYARSRRALVSKPHAPSTPTPFEGSSPDRLFRDVIRNGRAAGSDWRSVVDGLRPRTIELWKSLSWEQRDQFRRRLQVYWDVHRHRAPEKAHRVVDLMRRSGQVDIAPGSVVSINGLPHGFEVTLSSKGRKETLDVGWIVNCTGPSSDLRGAAVPFLESLVRAGLAEYDPLGIGLLVDDDGRTSARSEVFTLGPLCKGCRFETTAMPEIRVQAERLANLIAEND